MPFDESAAKKEQEAWAVHLVSTVEITNSIGMQLTLIPPGRFDMGRRGNGRRASLGVPGGYGGDKQHGVSAAR